MSQPRTPRLADVQEKPSYYHDVPITTCDLALDRNYLLHRARRHNRMLHGWGVRSGFRIGTVVDVQAKIDRAELPPDVAAADFSARWLTLMIGYAINPLGEEIALTKNIYLNAFAEIDGALVSYPGFCRASHLAQAVDRRDAEYRLVVETLEEELRPVRTPTSRCGDHPEQFAYARLKDTLRFRLLEKITEAYDTNSADYEEKLLLGTAQRTYVVLGSIAFRGKAIHGISSAEQDVLKKT